MNSENKRILIIRTDRIGDVLLSTPAIKAVRDYYSDAYIAMMVRPYAREIVEGNPHLDEVIIYDKFGKQKSWLDSAKFAMFLRKKRFDTAIILHPTNRVNIISFFAGIPSRIGYNRKFGFLLTQKINHDKQLGEKHESEYNFDILRLLGIETKNKDMFIPLNKDAGNWAEEILGKNNISFKDLIIAVHPGASCPSKIWPLSRFSELANNLIEKYQAKIVVVSGKKDRELAEKVIESINGKVIDLSGKTSISQLASILKRCKLFISNDSGPVHVSSAVGTPVISIFGRNQPGLSPKRWGPLGEKDRYLHKDVGCIECLAHNCKKELICLKSIKVEDVLEAIDEILKL